MQTFITRTLLIVLTCSFLFEKTFAQIDTAIGTNTPQAAGSTYQSLAHALCDELPDDYRKTNAIYNWITHNIKYDVKAMQQGRLKEEDPKKVFKQRKGMCGGYSLLFAAMCNEVGIKAIMIDGYSKDWMFDDGDKLYIPRHAWNVVYVDQRWRLVDATWGAGGLSQEPGWLKKKMSKASQNPLLTGKLKFVFNYDTTFFLSDPLVFRLRHLPTDPVWQLTDTAMPLSVFEAGELAIKNFNTQYTLLADNTEEQNKLIALDEHARIQASAARISVYNPRFRVVMAAKHQADAMDTIAANAGSGLMGNLALTSVQQGLKNAEQEVNDQKKTISVEYTALSAKNKTKNLQAKQYVQALHSDNKRMIAQCKSNIKRVGTITTSIKKKGAAASKGGKDIGACKLSEITTAAKPESVNSTNLIALKDSVTNRNTRIDSLQPIILQQQKQLAAAKEININRLDSMASIFVLADSALTEETINRIRMHDNYDEEVMQWNRLVKTVRLEQVDSMQKNYFVAYDSINSQYENLRKTQWEQITMYRKNLKDMERYKRRNDNPDFLSQYDKQVNAHDTCIIAYYQTLAAYNNYAEKHKELFNNLIKLYERQEKLADYMEKSEEKRKELEENSLTKKEDFDKKENEKQKEQLKQTGKQAEKMLSVNK